MFLKWMPPALHERDWMTLLPLTFKPQLSDSKGWHWPCVSSLWPAKIHQCFRKPLPQWGRSKVKCKWGWKIFSGCHLVTSSFPLDLFLRVGYLTLRPPENDSDSSLARRMCEISALDSRRSSCCAVFLFIYYLFALCVPCQCEPQWAPLSASPSPWKMAGRPDTKPQSQDLPPQGCTRGEKRSFVALRRPYPRLQSKWHSAWILVWVNIKKSFVQQPMLFMA